MKPPNRLPRRVPVACVPFFQERTLAPFPIPGPSQRPLHRRAGVLQILSSAFLRAAGATPRKFLYDSVVLASVRSLYHSPLLLPGKYLSVFSHRRSSRGRASVTIVAAMVLLGLTGGIATGKSTVSGMLRDHGFPVIDADAVARKVVQPGESAYGKLRAEFGSLYFDDENGGVLKRDLLGKLVFSNPEKRKRLNAITHPAIRWEMFKQFIWLLITGTDYIIFDTPLLYEVGYDKIISNVVVVWCDSDKELERLKKRDGLSEEDARARIGSQMTIEEKKKRATKILDNNGSIDELREQVKELANELKASWTPIVFRSVITSLVGGMIILVFRTVRLI